MATVSKKNGSILKQARERFDQGQSDNEHNLEAARDDIRFLNGQQWPEEILSKRKKESRPAFTYDHLSKFVAQVVNDQQQNRPQIKVRPIDDKGDIDTARVYEGLIRHIEVKSNADAAYDTAYGHAVAHGFGFFRVNIEYEEADSFERVLRIRRVMDSFTVTFDPNAVEMDYSDAEWCFVDELLTEDEFTRRYPKADKSSFDSKRVSQNQRRWTQDNMVRVAEYWVKDIEKRTIVRLIDSDGQEIVDTLDKGMKVADVEAAGFIVMESREADVPVVKQYIISGSEVLEGPSVWPGKNIPIVPVLGVQSVVDGRVKLRGIVRHAKDAQRNYNFHKTAEAETVALSPKAPFLMTPRQVKGFEDEWAKANTENQAYLLYNPDRSGGAATPQRQFPQSVPTGQARLADSARQDIKEVIGIFDSSLGAPSNEKSGKAILARQREGDTATFNFLSNLRRAVTYTGTILVELIPKVYANKQAVRILNPDRTSETVAINEQFFDFDNNQQSTRNDLSAGKYDVTVETGPSYGTKRAETADQLIQLAGQFPQLGELGADVIVKSMDFDGSQELAERFRKTLPPGMVQGDEANQEPPQPTPQEQLQAMQLQVEMEKVKADMANAQADIALAEAKQAQAAADLAEAQALALTGGRQTGTQ